MKKSNSVFLKIQDPSGETRRVEIPAHRFQQPEPVWIGRDSSASIPLRDPTVPVRLGRLIREDSGEIWIDTQVSGFPLRLGDLSTRLTHWAEGVPARVGETTLTLSQARNQDLGLPQAPSGIRSWQTFGKLGRDLLWMVKKSASTPLSVYLAGETGTGKEVLSQLIHAWSDRASGAFVPLNCAALPLSLAESELFGHVKGAFTGAASHRAGALMQAHNGTLFLDEIGDLPMELQVKLLRFLENGEIRPVGSDRSSHANVRIICATHKPLETLVEEGKFRRDLYFRLASISIQIPALRERPEDIEALARIFAKELNRTLTPQAIERLKFHDWPGNVRELRHAIERACGFSGAFQEIIPESAFDFLAPKSPDALARPKPGPDGAPGVMKLAEMEKILLLRALNVSRGNRARAARSLGIARSTLFEMIKRHRICGPRSGDFWLADLSSRQQA
ncbi:MAG: sigma 54-interacting transcriptional regulator [Bdellovibrionales bacterium]|nr:sigma 54-interacting transcriptional regulator [Bdellovibrionales bacterium]